MRKQLVTAAILTIAAFGLAGCGDQPVSNSGADAGVGGNASGRVFAPIDPNAVVFWDRQTMETADLMTQIAGEFNAGRQGLPLKVEYLGEYNDLYRKVSLSIQARELPGMAVSYESMTAEYAASGAAIALDDYVHDPEIGFAKEEFEDFFPSVIETNTFAQLGNKMYSFPLCKSVLMMYFNKAVLAKAGITEPPKTWDEFLDQCRQIKAKTGKHAYAISVDCSTVDGWIFSMGGQVTDGTRLLYDSPAAIKTFELLETLAKEGLAYQIQPGSYFDREDFAHDEVAFFFRSSSHKPYTQMLMAARPNDWGMAMIPQADPANPKTVLYGPNICIFKTTEEQQKVAWGFVKYFTSRDVGVRWALASGYVPIRKSAANHPDILKHWEQWPYNRAAFDCLQYAKAEPNLAGWQEVRALVERAESAVLSKMKSGKQAAQDLQAQATSALASR
ncbi:MAG: extracellular solute-binding protein [Candidatus Hydrogenedentes bacterium]|nr:extracellular solute-binding protein [Candidatus Hydrogenedentota bacterium]